MSQIAAGPRIVIPPPLVFVAGWVIGWLLSRIQPFEIDGAGVSAAQSGIGLTLLAAGLTLMAWGLLTFVRARTTVLPMRPARRLVMHGPYRFTRNPMYLGLTTAYIGLAAVLNQAWPLVLLPVVLIVLTVVIIEKEEAHLLEKFGEEYERYRRKVRRWL